MLAWVAVKLPGGLVRVRFVGGVTAVVRVTSPYAWEPTAA